MLEVLTAAPDTDLTTVSAVEAEVGVLDATQQSWAAARIKHASALIVQEANQFFAKQNYKETIPGSGNTEIMLSRTPIIGTPTILSTNNDVIVDFTVEDAEAGILYRRLGWTKDISYMPSITRDPLAYEEHPSFIITYDAGYHLPSFPAAIPAGDIALTPNVELACILTVKYWYHKQKQHPDTSWKQVGDLAIGYRGDSKAKGVDMNKLPPEARGLIKPRIF